jgi:bifunctional non-homologous end joining protein LigD
VRRTPTPVAASETAGGHKATSLREYRRKRAFSVTPEPSGRAAPRGTGRSFVVQKHAASRLHYDFRLELDGVLKSWAVPRGPSLDPGEKRLAMRTEDHPVEYGSFEGVIPEGEYGGGTVLLWDRGTWEPMGDPHQGLAKGKLDFVLRGKKLRGRWTLIKIPGRESRDADKAWLLIKARDDAARSSGDFDVTGMLPKSVATDRALEEIARARDQVWHSAKPAKTSSRRRAATPAASRRVAAAASGAKRSFVRTRRRRVSKAATTGEAQVAGIRITHPDRIVYPPQGITKLDLARFYESIADWILPHLRSRPTSLVRCPEGLARECFYQKHVGVWAPAALRRVRIREKKKVGDYLVVDDLPGLIGLVQIGILEIHTWNAVVERLEQPDRLVFDLDPGDGVPWRAVVAAAHLVRAHLQHLGLESFLKTTGGKGLHLVVPIDAGPGWDDCLAFARSVAEDLARKSPRAFTANVAKNERRGRIYIDYLRNLRGATAVAAYSTRARPGAPVSTPLSWDELSPRLRSDHYTVSNLPRRLASLRIDPWTDYDRTRQALPAHRR